MMRLRLSYLEVHELTETALIFLYYLQAKQFVLNGTCSIDENQVVEYASLQLQASFGDYDADNMKTLVSSFELYLPPQYLKFSLSRNEAWWLKRLSTAYQQHRGLTKTEAEKAYIAMVQTMQLYPFQLFSPMVE